jgi:hypothetical protein
MISGSALAVATYLAGSGIDFALGELRLFGVLRT